MSLVCLFASSAACLAQQTRPITSTQPVPPPRETKLTSGDAKIDGILDRLEVKGQSIKGIACKLTWKYVVVEPVEDVQTKEGDLLFSRGAPNSMFLIRFDKRISGGVVSTQREEYLFDGRWLTEKNEKARTVIRREIVRPGERVDPFKLGKGPFPLPFGQSRHDILSAFTVALAKPDAKDPAETDHLACVPKPNTELAAKYAHVDIYVSRKLELPVRIVTESARDSSRVEVDFREIDSSAAPAMSRFAIDVPADYTKEEEPLPPEPKFDLTPVDIKK